MAKYIVNTDCVIDISPYVAAKKDIVCQKGFKVGGKESYIGNMTVILTTVTDPSGNVCPAINITITPSSKSVKSKGLHVLLENDSGNSEGTFTNPSTGGQIIESVTARIVNAGQVHVKGM